MPTRMCSVPDTLVFAMVRAESQWVLWHFRASAENCSWKKRSGAVVFPMGTRLGAGTGHAHVFGAKHTRVCIGTGRVSVGIVALSSIGGELQTKKMKRCTCLAHGQRD